MSNLAIVPTAEGQYYLGGALTAVHLQQDWSVAFDDDGELAPANQALTLDLLGIEQVDSAGLAWLVNMARDCRLRGISLSLLNMPEGLQKLAKISDAHQLLPLQ